MTNILNAILVNQSINPSNGGDTKPFFNISSDGKVKPKEYKGKLLPSRIFGSPIEYAKDLKKDVVSIGKAAKGQANDYELGRINDLAMKAGSLGLAAYLFVKNPLKLSKAMEIAGFGTFFASMALWPKLAIQAPLKARTGVDIHQKYIDSQGRKKMLFQDPQYVLTDLYSKEDLEKMGDKLKVSKNLPDRDNFIKQRAQKTALQGNTLWMMTAGVATPVMSALACNGLEKPINSIIEKVDIASSTRAVKNIDKQGLFAKIKNYFASKSLDKFISQNADKQMSDKLISDIASRLGARANSANVQSAIAEELKALKNTVKIDESFITNALKDRMPALNEVQKNALNQAIEHGQIKQISSILSRAANVSQVEQRNLAKEFEQILTSAKQTMEKPSVSQVADKIKALQSNVTNFANKKGILDRFISARVGDKSGTYIANQWGKVGDKLIKSLKLSGKELKAVSEGNIEIVLDKLSTLSANDKQYEKVVQELMKLIGDYETKTSSAFTSQIKGTAQSVCNAASEEMKANGFTKLADIVSNAAKKGTVENVININAAERISGAQSSFYRLLQSLDLFKGMNNGTLNTKISEVLKANGQAADDAAVGKIVEACKKVLMSATTTDYVEKLKSSGFNLSEGEYKTVMKVLFDSEADSAIEKSLKNSLGADKAKDALKGFKAYKREFMDKVANWQNGITPELSRCTVDGVTNGANAVERNNLAGKPVGNMIKDIAKKTYNSNKWLKIFGITMIALTAVTITATLLLGRKSKVEKEAEVQQKANG